MQSTNLVNHPASNCQNLPDQGQDNPLQILNSTHRLLALADDDQVIHATLQVPAAKHANLTYNSKKNRNSRTVKLIASTTEIL